MRSRVFVSLLLVASLMSLSVAQDSLRVIRTVQDPPGEIVGHSGVNYMYDPSDYATRPFGVYKMSDGDKTITIAPWEGPEDNEGQTDIWRIPEKDLGGWELKFPALLLETDSEDPFKFTLYWSYMTSQSIIPTKDDNNQTSFNFDDENITCLDVVAISHDEVILDCANYDEDTKYLRHNVLIHYNVASKETLHTVTTDRKLTNANTTCDRKVAYHNFGGKAWVYRWPTLSCANQLISLGNDVGIEILDVSNWENVTSSYLFNETSFGKEDFNFDTVSIFMGDIFVANTKDTYVARLTNFEGDYDRASLSYINIPDYPLAIRAFYDAILDGSGISLVVATKRTIYRIDWSDERYPFIVETVAYGIGQAQEISGVTDLTSVWATPNWYFIMADTDHAIYTFLRKSHNVSIPVGYYYFDEYMGKNSTLTLPGVAKALVVDTEGNYFHMITDKATGSFQQLQIYQTFNGDTKDENFTIITNIDDNPDPIFAYKQNLENGNNKQTGSFAYNYADAMIVSHNSTPVTWLLGIRTMADPVTYDNSGLINSTTFLSRVEQVAHNGSEGNFTFNYFLSNPFNWRNNFYWLHQDDEKNVELEHCRVNENWQTHGLELHCDVIASAELTRTVTQAALGFDSEEHTITFIAIGSSDDGNLTFYSADNFEVIETVEQTCDQLETTRSHSRSFVYCLSENSIRFFTTEIDNAFQDFTIDQNALNLDAFEPIGITTSPRYPDLLFIQQAKSILIVTTSFAPDTYKVISTVALNEIEDGNTYAAVITEDQIIVVQSNNRVSNYDLSNIRSVRALNSALPFNNITKVDITSLTSTGSGLFVLNYNDNQAAVFDSDLPDFRDFYNIDCPDVVGALAVAPETELIFCLNDNALSVIQYFNVIRLQSVVNTPANDQFVQSGAINIEFPNLSKEFELTYDVYVPSFFQVTNQPINESTLVVDLSTTEKTHEYAGDITELFKGPLNGTFSIEAEHDNETGVFTLDGPFYTTSYKLNFTPHSVAAAVNFQNTIYLLSNEGQPTVYEVDPSADQIVKAAYQIILPNDDVASYHCSHLLVFDHPIYKTTFILACRYNVTGDVSLIYQTKGAVTSFFTFPDLDAVAQIRFNTTEDTLFVVGDRHEESYLFIYQINSTINATGASQYSNLVPLVYNLNSFFGLEGREFGTMVDFEFVNGPLTEDGLPTIYFLFLQSNFGIRTAKFTAIAGERIGFLEPYYEYRIGHSDTFKDESIPDLGWWTGIHIQDESTFLDDNNLNILLVQSYGFSYLVKFNLENGFNGILQKFYPYSNNLNLGAAQFLDGKVTFATLHFGHPDFNIAIVSYPFDADSLNPANPTLPWGAFGSVLPSLIWNDKNTDTKNVWTIDRNGNLNKISPDTKFTLKFVGSSTNVVRSKKLTLTAYGGFDSSAEATFTVVLPVPDTPDEPGTNVALIIILSILGIGLIAGGFFVFKKWKSKSSEGGEYTKHQEA